MAQEQFFDPEMPDILIQWRHYLSVLDLRRGLSVLDVGCNRGDAERLMLQDYPGLGRVVALDKDPRRVEAARACLRKHAGRDDWEVVEGDAHSLPFANGTFDRVLCAETLEWVADPVRAAQEIRRVLKPGGLALLQHSDFDTQVYTTPRLDLLRQFVHAFTDSGPDGVIGRKLPGIACEAGFSAVSASVYVLANRQFCEPWYGFRVFAMMKDWLLQKGLMPQEKIQALETSIRETAEAGSFFYSINRDLCLCRK